MRLRYLIVAPLLFVAGLYAAPTAAADCVTTGNQTFCSFGEPGETGPVLPYECVDPYDYYCNDTYNHWELF